MIADCIVVGLDDSAGSRAAHRWAAAYANATGKDLRAVHVLEWPIGLTSSAVKSGTRLHVPQQDVAEAYRRGMHRVFDDITPPHGSVLQFAQGDPADVLVRLSSPADLLVVGTREPLGRALYPTGSVSHYCISRASCPVVTVPELRADSVANRSSPPTAARRRPLGPADDGHGTTRAMEHGEGGRARNHQSRVSHPT